MTIFNSYVSLPEGNSKKKVSFGWIQNPKSSVGLIKNVLNPTGSTRNQIEEIKKTVQLRSKGCWWTFESCDFKTYKKKNYPGIPSGKLT